MGIACLGCHVITVIIAEWCIIGVIVLKHFSFGLWCIFSHEPLYSLTHQTFDLKSLGAHLPLSKKVYDLTRLGSCDFVSKSYGWVIIATNAIHTVNILVINSCRAHTAWVLVFFPDLLVSAPVWHTSVVGACSREYMFCHVYMTCFKGLH